MFVFSKQLCYEESQALHEKTKRRVVDELKLSSQQLLRSRQSQYHQKDYVSDRLLFLSQPRMDLLMLLFTKIKTNIHIYE